jgi:hypothetical protein
MAAPRAMRGTRHDQKIRAARKRRPRISWNTETLTRLPADSIQNAFAYNTFKAGLSLLKISTSWP